MSEPLYFKSAKSLTIAEIAALTGAEPGPQAPPDRTICGVAPLDTATPGDLAFLDNPRYADQIASTRAGACLVAPRFVATAPAHVPVLRVRDPYRAFVAVARALYPQALRPSSLFAADGAATGSDRPCVGAARERGRARSRRRRRPRRRDRHRTRSSAPTP